MEIYSAEPVVEDGIYNIYDRLVNLQERSNTPKTKPFRKGVGSHDYVYFSIEREIDNWKHLEYPKWKWDLGKLLYAISNAKSFINFVTFGISQLFLGCLVNLAYSKKIAIRGLVSNAHSETMGLIETINFDHVDSFLKIKALGQENSDYSNVLHQKLIVIDGLFAIKGSMNFTISGIEKVEFGRDILETSTDLKEIQWLHNKFFTPVWEQFRVEPEGHYVPNLENLDDPYDLVWEEWRRIELRSLKKYQDIDE